MQKYVQAQAQTHIPIVGPVGETLMLVMGKTTHILYNQYKTMYLLCFANISSHLFSLQ